MGKDSLLALPVCALAAHNTFMKLRKVYHEPGDAHELTFSTFNQRPLLDDQAMHSLAESINRAKQRHNFDLWAYVFMPNHVHLLIHPQAEIYDSSRILNGIKQPVSKRMRAVYETSNPDLVHQLTVARPGGRQEFRFWQQGGGYDRCLNSTQAIRASIDYIHNNPAKAELCRVDEYVWSSWREYEGLEEGLVKVDLWEG